MSTYTVVIIIDFKQVKNVKHITLIKFQMSTYKIAIASEVYGDAHDDALSCKTTTFRMKAYG